jgi:periplasmic copper chaperone A
VPCCRGNGIAPWIHILDNGSTGWFCGHGHVLGTSSYGRTGWRVDDAEEAIVDRSAASPSEAPSSGRPALPGRRWRAAGSAVAAALAIVVAGPAPSASAHVSITPSTTAAGAYAVLDVSVPHGCEGSPTTEVTIRMPDEINAVTPTRNALWEVEKEVVQLDPPVTDAHGNELTERVASVTYRADVPLPEGYRDVFELSVQIPDAAGTTLVFPTVQTCKRGETAWIEVPGEGQDPDELASPAPAFEITADETSGHQEPAAAAGESGGGTAAAAGDAGETDPLALGALGVGLLGLLAGTAAIVLQRRRA